MICYLGYTSGFSLSCMVFFLCAVIYKKSLIPCPLSNSTTTEHNLYTNGYNSTTVTGEVCTAKMFTLNTQSYQVPDAECGQRIHLCHVHHVPVDCSDVESEMLHTYMKVDPLDKLMLCVRVAVLVAVTLTVPVVLFPIRRAIQQLVCPGQDFRWWRHILIAVCLLFLVNLLVIFIPNIKDIFGVIGATSAPSLIFILPSIFYIRIVPNEKEPLLSRPKIQAAIFAALGFVFMIMSLSFIIVDWTTGGKSNVGGH
ncbi:hypothetical protein AB205_0121030 [Aquarana catesbeiana]|uniref:Amino acid transporter transmembrane domain-containing protein n=1 Tax=Aquarana catesbeiana TaxID=8400 RepID=A0A2G9RV67_AQUCT|nr:hypothetical protein AB205_0121030 [Aquarana catesbeiana]